MRAAEMVPETDARLRTAMEDGRSAPGYLAMPEANRKISRRSSSSTRIAASTRISRTWRGAWRSKVSWPSRPTICSGSAARRPTRTRRAKCSASLKPEDALATSSGVRAALARHPEGNGKVGAVGFCWGGGQVNALAVADPELAAGVAYYGSPAESRQVETIKAPLLLHYAGMDERINAGIAAFEEALKADGKTYEIHIYEGANHAFNNDTNAARYNKEAADLAWGRTVEFLKKHAG